jgi:hypothetical protein
MEKSLPDQAFAWPCFAFPATQPGDAFLILGNDLRFYQSCAGARKEIITENLL